MNRAVNYFINRFILQRKFLVAREKAHQLRFRFRVEDFVGRSIYKYGVYDAQISRFLLNHLQLSDKDVVIDIGANIGWYSVLLAKNFPAKLLSFEPDSLNYQLLEGNIARNGLTNIDAFPYALSFEKAHLALYRYKNANLGRHSLLPINAGGEESVQAIVLDDFLTEQNVPVEAVKFIKIDIEGYEYLALKGARRLLRHVPLIFSEFSPGIMLENNLNPQDYLDLLSSYAYSPYELNEGRLVPQSIDALAAMSDGVIDIFWQK